MQTPWPSHEGDPSAAPPQPAEVDREPFSLLLPVALSWTLAALRAGLALADREPYGAEIAIAYVILLLFTPLLWQELRDRSGGLGSLSLSSHGARPGTAERGITPSPRHP